MITRQKFIYGATASAATAAGASFIVQACSSQFGQGRYESVVQSTSHPVKAPAGDKILLRQDLVRYAMLAPSSHNTRC